MPLPSDLLGGLNKYVPLGCSRFEQEVVNTKGAQSTSWQNQILRLDKAFFLLG